MCRTKVVYTFIPGYQYRYVLLFHFRVQSEGFKAGLSHGVQQGLEDGYATGYRQGCQIGEEVSGCGLKISTNK